ncbi:LEA type 2 family protein [Halapricum desulfuricans]|uniref:LEA14-like dessication related protein n=1 Tax=Halapricum desulfuricans TaxID=2841257 RepID=A0A897N406_9EURY|nr:LEA type 2 family protein [Halapricum desulfuricans]QSG07682.1 LEA14-like dessication related protein [Halapricum desulfuricans]
MDLPEPVRSALDTLPAPRTVVVAVVVSLGLIALLVTVLVATGVLAQPTVESIDSQWGEATNETTQIETQAIVDNPNPIGIPGVVSVEYTASLNDIVLVDNEKSGIGLSPGKNTIEFTAAMDNDRIADWWVTHINGDERSTMTIEPTVSGPGVSQSLPDQTSDIETDLLAGLNTAEPQPVGTSDREYFTAESTSVEWGEATPQVAPLDIRSMLRNEQPVPITIREISYDVSIGGVTLANGSQDDGTTIGPGESGVVDPTIDLDNSRMDEWWVSHVENGERSTLSVDAWATIEAGGQTETVPLSMFATNETVETDLLG